MFFQGTFYRKPRHSFVATVLIFVFVASSYPAACERNNSWVRGSTQLFKSLLTLADTTQCREAVCPLPTRPILLTVKTPMSSVVRIRLESAKLAAPVSSRDENSVAYPTTPRMKHPILLRGTILAGEVLPQELPVAAAISRSEGRTILTVTLPLVASRRVKAKPSPITLRAILPEISAAESELSFHPNARTELSSRYAFQGVSCGAVGQQRAWAMTRMATAETPTRGYVTYPTLYIATDFDAQFAGRIRCSSVSACNDAIVRIIHSASVFYERQLGYTVAVARQFGPTSIGGSTAPSTVLDSAQQLSLQPRREFIHTRANTADNQVDLFQFFTGRTMREKTIGIAYVGTVCRDDETDFAQSVVQHVSNSLNPVITAHEIGHTLDALHTSSGIMRPQLSSNPPKSFASPSILAISNHLDTWYPECRQGFSSGSTPPTPTPTPRQDGSSSSNPHVGKPVTMSLAAQSRFPRTISLSATTTALNPSCSVLIRGGATSIAALRGNPIVQFVPTQLTSIVTGTVSFRVRERPSTGSNVYFVAEHVCSDGTILEVSRIRKFNPNRIKGISRAQKSKRAWLNTLRQSVTSND